LKQKKTVAEDPETHNKITKVVKTEVTEITRTITINDQHDLERAKRELGIDDVNRLVPSTQIIYNLPSTSWIDHPRITEIKEKRYEPHNEIVTSGDFILDSPTIDSHEKQDLNQQEKQLAEATTVGRGIASENTSQTVVSTGISSIPTTTTTKIDDKTKKEKKIS